MLTEIGKEIDEERKSRARKYKKKKSEVKNTMK